MNARSFTRYSRRTTRTLFYCDSRTRGKKYDYVYEVLSTRHL